MNMATALRLIYLSSDGLLMSDRFPQFQNVPSILAEIADPNPTLARRMNHRTGSRRLERYHNIIHKSHRPRPSRQPQLSGYWRFFDLPVGQRRNCFLNEFNRRVEG
jgi:hypothetical protein